MILQLDYGTRGLIAEFPDARTTVIEPLHPPATPDSLATLAGALKSPLGKPPLRQMATAGKKIGISVCDITRAQPRRLMIEALLAEMPGEAARSEEHTSELQSLR